MLWMLKYRETLEGHPEPGGLHTIYYYYSTDNRLANNLPGKYNYQLVSHFYKQVIISEEEGKLDLPGTVLQAVKSRAQQGTTFFVGIACNIELFHLQFEQAGWLHLERVTVKDNHVGYFA